MPICRRYIYFGVPKGGMHQCQSAKFRIVTKSINHRRDGNECNHVIDLQQNAFPFSPKFSLNTKHAPFLY